MLKIKHYIDEIQKILLEIKNARLNISQVFSQIKKLNLKYQKKELNYKNYYQIKNNILNGRSEDEVMSSFENYSNALKKRIVELNAKILNKIYNDTSFESLNIGKVPYELKATKELPPLSSLDIAEIELAQIKIEKKRIPIIKQIQRTPESFILPPVPIAIKFSFGKRLIYAMQAKEKPWITTNKNIVFGGLFSKEFFNYLFKGQDSRKSDSYIGDTKILPSILSYEGKIPSSSGISIKTEVLDPYLLEKQIKELKSIISKKKPEIYKANSLGYIANITVRKISIYFIEKNPIFFKKVYQQVRYANLKILANTYINIIFFLTFISTIIAFPILTMFFALQGNPFGIMLIKTIFGSLLIGSCMFGLGFYYPSIQAKNRKRSINTNLPFAIDHMSSVIASGVSPAIMFKLISHSREYGDISVEIEKVTNYIEFFGYDILTSLKAVALITPSNQFKEFIDGFVSTIETGGDLKDYLSQKSAEALLNYRLERQKYVESLGTYSDIYTGVLIAAPLFFVTALSLVSVLGGKIGGMNVNTIMTIGTYIAIPIMNILFIIFLEINQPEI